MENNPEENNHLNRNKQTRTFLRIYFLNNIKKTINKLSDLRRELELKSEIFYLLNCGVLLGGDMVPSIDRVTTCRPRFKAALVSQTSNRRCFALIASQPLIEENLNQDLLILHDVRNLDFL